MPNQIENAVKINIVSMPAGGHINWINLRVNWSVKLSTKYPSRACILHYEEWCLTNPSQWWMNQHQHCAYPCWNPTSNEGFYTPWVDLRPGRHSQAGHSSGSEILARIVSTATIQTWISMSIARSSMQISNTSEIQRSDRNQPNNKIDCIYILIKANIELSNEENLHEEK